jgi:NADPH-dependent curcumin reductase
MRQTFRQWALARPLAAGEQLTPGHFARRELPMPDIAAGEALVRVRLINVHSRTRQRILAGDTRLGETDPSNYACAQVIRSRDPAFREGDVIACQAGWQDHAIVRSGDSAIGYGPITAAARALNGTNSQWTYAFRPALAERWPADVLMDVFGTSGMTAWFGLRECGPVGPSDHVLVGGASGSVGALFSQLARNAGARVIGLAGGADRCEWVTASLGIADCLDYRAADFAARLAAAFPEGIDLFSDGIGGDLTALAIARMNPGARLFSYGSSAAFYGAGAVAGRTLRERFGVTAALEPAIAQNGIRVACWIVDQFYGERRAAEDALAALLEEGSLQPVNTLVRGFDRLPGAIANLYARPRQGKLQISFE